MTPKLSPSNLKHIIRGAVYAAEGWDSLRQKKHHLGEVFTELGDDGWRRDWVMRLHYYSVEQRIVRLTMCRHVDCTQYSASREFELSMCQEEADDLIPLILQAIHGHVESLKSLGMESLRTYWWSKKASDRMAASRKISQNVADALSGVPRVHYTDGMSEDEITPDDIADRVAHDSRYE